MNLSKEIFSFNHQTLLEIDNALMIVYYVIDVSIYEIRH